MQLAAFIPKHFDLNRSKFRDNGGSNRLTLRVQHMVTGTVAGKERSGEGNIDYNLDFPKKASLNGNLRIGGSVFIGVQSSDLINQATLELRPRTAYSFSKVLNAKFDMRALCYVLGAATTVGIGNCDFDLPANPAGYRTLGTGWSVPDIGDVVFGPNVASTPGEFATLMSLCGAAGVKACTVLADDIPGTSGNFMVGRNLACYARRVAANVFQAANETLCYGAHRKAYECGKTSGLTLNAHTDEGGWIRKLMGKCQYPRPVGIVYGMGQEFGGIPLQETIDREDIMRLIIGEYLEFVALFPVADYEVNGTQTVLDPSVESPLRPGDFELLPNQIYRVMDKIRDLLCDRDGFHRDANHDTNAHNAYVMENSVDDHFKVERLVPWWFVEPAPLLIGIETSLPMPAKHGEVVKLPLVRSTEVMHDCTSLDVLGRAGPGNTSWIVRTPGGIRMEGMSYISSSAYSVENGMAQFKMKARAPDGTVGGDFMFLDLGANNLAEARWVTPHNSMPIPTEGMSLDPTVLEYTHVSQRSDFTPGEFSDGWVESRLTPFLVVDDSPTAGSLVHKSIPPHLRRKLRLTNATHKKIHFLKVLSDREVVPLSETAPPQVNDEDVLEQKEAPAVKELSAPMDADEPTKMVELSPEDTGVRPKQPTVKTLGNPKDDQSGNGT